VVTNDTLPLSTRLWFAWICFFQVLFDAAFAARVWSARRLGPAPATATATATSTSTPTPTSTSTSTPTALLLLSLFQREGRLVDFLEQDITAFSDADVGAAARVVHGGCRKVLHAHAAIEPVRSEEEGTRVTVAAGFDADALKLVGDVRGEPPHDGVLRHRGWRLRKFELPQTIGAHDTRIIAPAEVELG
jgi:hypothetical protein